MSGILAVAAGGVVGALARYGVYLASGHWLGHGFPFATLIVNVVGSFAMGVLIEAMALVWTTSNEMPALSHSSFNRPIFPLRL